MSHQPERKEKNCLNCGTVVIGRYCHVCGQENVETKESFWSLVKHFIFDIFHFDGNFFHTLKYIFAKPGSVAREYCSGKRMQFLHPIRMYLFTSAIFFLVFASVNHIAFEQSKNGFDKISKKDRLEAAADYKRRLQSHPADTSLQKIVALLTDTTKEVTEEQIIELDTKPFLTVTGNNYANRKQYDSIQQTLPQEKRDGWFKRTLITKVVDFNEEYKGRNEEATRIFWESFLHRLPYMLFLSLPFFALILKLLYVRRKNFYYSDHAVFTFYHYILSFILLLVVFAVSTSQDKTGWRFLYYVEMFFLIAWPIYLLLEMKNFYKQGWGKTVIKFFLLNFLGLIVIFLLFAIFLLFSIFQL